MRFQSNFVGHPHCTGECGAVEEYVIEIDINDVSWIEIRSGEKLLESEPSPVVAGTLPDGRMSYLLVWLDKSSKGHLGSGPSRKESCFLVISPESQLYWGSPDMADGVYVWTLRYGEDAYGSCEYYTNRMRTVIGVDWTGPFCWEFRRYLNDACLSSDEFSSVSDVEHQSTIEEVSEECDEDQDENLKYADPSAIESKEGGDMDSDNLSEE